MLKIPALLFTMTMLSFSFATETPTIYSFTVNALTGGTIDFASFKGKKILVVNVASECGYTPQYAGLEKLYENYKDKLVIVGFPCNQFGAQEPGTEAQIAQFCAATYDVSFPMFAKVDVNGDKTHPLYRLLKHAAPGLLGSEAIKWNFTKFLISRNGKVLERFAPQTEPSSIAKAVEKALSAKP